MQRGTSFIYMFTSVSAQCRLIGRSRGRQIQRNLGVTPYHDPIERFTLENTILSMLDENLSYNLNFKDFPKITLKKIELKAKD